MYLFAPYLILFLSVGASAQSLNSPDISLIKRWDQEFYNTHPYQPFPKVVYFNSSKNGATLTFVATKHKDWKNSHEKIEKAIQQVKPDVILIEGVARTDGLSAHIWDDKISQNLNVEGFEDYFAYKLALQAQIPFVGAELPGKMSDHSSYERDVAVIARIAELISKYKNVMVIYGAGHYVQQELALIKMMGSPTRIE